MCKRKSQLVYLALLLTGLVLPMQSWALGLGEINVESSLNERFVGTIELLDVQGFQPAEIVVDLATPEDFARLGVERLFYLTQLQFSVDVSVDKGASAGPYIKVSSEQPILEPDLNFVVVILWPNGRLLKAFTVRLEPPTFSQSAAPVPSAPVPSTAAPSQPARQSSLPSTGSAVTANGGFYTSPDDTLWSIAVRTLPSARVSVNQQMLAIQRLNRHAFMRNNINLLQAGYELTLPSEEEALSMSVSAAIYAVVDQANDWQGGVDLAPPPDAGTDAAPLSRSARDQQGQVRIVANTDELASATAGGSGNSNSNSNSNSNRQINRLIEEKATLNRQVDELNYQLEREKEIAANQLSVKERQLEVKDQEIAELQQQLQQAREQLENAPRNQSLKPGEPEVWWQNPIPLGIMGMLLLAVLLVTLRRKREETSYAGDYPEADTSIDTTEEDRDITLPADRELRVAEDGIVADPELPGAGESGVDDFDLDLDLGHDLDHDKESDDGDPDNNNIRLDLAEAYVNLGDVDGARDILNEVLEEGTDQQQSKAREMLAKL